jgi:hypothetical protein
MHRAHPARSLAASLALLATLFGGLFYGAGNMLMLATSPGFASVLHGDHGGHEGHGEHDHGAVDALVCGDGVGPATRAAPAPDADGPLGIPAHCVFCLDGTAPTPVEVVAAAADPLCPEAPRLRPNPAPAASVAVHEPRQPRAPPVRLV